MVNMKGKKRFMVSSGLYKKSKDMSYKEFCSMVQSIYDKAFKNGYEAACDDIVDDDTVMIATGESIVVELADDGFKAMLLSVEGIDDEKAKIIVEKIYTMYDK